MDSTPPPRRSESRLRTKSATRLLQLADDFSGNLCLNFSPSPQKPQPSPLRPSQHGTNQSVQLQDLLLVSPSSLRRSKHRAVERVEILDEPVDMIGGSRRKSKSRALLLGLAGCSSPRSSKRLRRRLEQDNREERELGFGEENVKLRKRRQSRSRREKLSLVPSISSPNPSPKIGNDDHISLDSVGLLILELIMWKDVAKSSLWFGCGTLFFLSSSLTRGYSFSIFSAVSQVGLLFLAISFFYNSFSQRNEEGTRKNFMLKEDDIVRAARVMLPAANAAIRKIRRLFSGEPAMTLKMAPILLFASQYGHLITLWRLSAIAFFISFTTPMLYSCYSLQIHNKVDGLRCRLSEAWAASSHKKIVALSAATVFWNLSAVKTRIFAAFISVVILRYYQQMKANEAKEGREKEVGELELVVANEEPDKEDLAIIVATEQTHKEQL